MPVPNVGAWTPSLGPEAGVLTSTASEVLLKQVIGTRPKHTSLGASTTIPAPEGTRVTLRLSADLSGPEGAV